MQEVYYSSGEEVNHPCHEGHLTDATYYKRRLGLYDEPEVSKIACRQAKELMVTYSREAQMDRIDRSIVSCFLCFIYRQFLQGDFPSAVLKVASKLLQVRLQPKDLSPIGSLQPRLRIDFEEHDASYHLRWCPFPLGKGYQQYYNYHSCSERLWGTEATPEKLKRERDLFASLAPHTELRWLDCEALVTVFSGDPEIRLNGAVASTLEEEELLSKASCYFQTGLAALTCALTSPNFRHIFGDQPASLMKLYRVFYAGEASQDSKFKKLLWGSRAVPGKEEEEEKEEVSDAERTAAERASALLPFSVYCNALTICLILVDIGRNKWPRIDTLHARSGYIDELFGPGISHKVAAVEDATNQMLLWKEDQYVQRFLVAIRRVETKRRHAEKQWAETMEDALKGLFENEESLQDTNELQLVSKQVQQFLPSIDLGIQGAEGPVLHRNLAFFGEGKLKKALEGKEQNGKPPVYPTSCPLSAGLFDIVSKEKSKRGIRSDEVGSSNEEEEEEEVEEVDSLETNTKLLADRLQEISNAAKEEDEIERLEKERQEEERQEEERKAFLIKEEKRRKKKQEKKKIKKEKQRKRAIRIQDIEEAARLKTSEIHHKGIKEAKRKERESNVAKRQKRETGLVVLSIILLTGAVIYSYWKQYTAEKAAKKKEPSAARSAKDKDKKASARQRRQAS